MSIFGEALSAALEDLGRKQSWLARQLEIDPGSVSRWVRGEQVPNDTNLARINKALGRDLSASASADRRERGSAQFEVFLATPMASFSTDEEYAENHLQMLDLLDSVESAIGPAYWAGRSIPDSSAFDAPGVGESENLYALKRARYCLFVQLTASPLATSALIEVGIALGWKLPVAIFAPGSQSVPYMMRGLPTVSEQLSFLPGVRLYEAANVDEVKRVVKVNGVSLFSRRRR